MANVLIVAHLLIVLAMIAVILLQRSEGGGLGIGGGNAGGLMTVRGTANVLTRTTAILAVLFFATSIGLTVLSEIDRGSRSILERATAVGEGAGAPASVLDALEQLQRESAGDLPVPPAPGTDGAAPAADGVGTTPVSPADDPGLAVPAPATPSP